MPGPRRHKRNPPPPPEIDERYFDDYFEHIFGALCGYLRKYAAFEDYLNDHPPEEPALD
jgi:hypothetical protein